MVFLLLGAVAFGAAPSPQSARPPQTPSALYALKLDFTEGQTTTYRVDIVYTLRRAGQTQPLYALRETLMEQLQVQKILPDGKVSLSLAVTDGAGMANGKTFTIKASKAPMEFIVATNGSVVASPRSKPSDASTSLPDFLQKATDLYGLVLPNHPITMGEHWSYSDAGNNTTVCLAGARQVGPYNTLLLKSLSVVPIHTFVPNSGAGSDNNPANGLILRGKLRIRGETDFSSKHGMCVRIVRHGWAELQVRTVSTVHGTKTAKDTTSVVVSQPIRMIATFEVTAGIVQ